jgi:hypothetical protein
MADLSILGLLWGLVNIWQVLALVALIGVIIFWKKYRDKQL